MWAKRMTQANGDQGTLGRVTKGGVLSTKRTGAYTILSGEVRRTLLHYFIYIYGHFYNTSHILHHNGFSEIFPLVIFVDEPL